jgi:hypothetical protein
VSKALIEGYPAEQLPDALSPELLADVLSGRSIVARAGSAKILLSAEIKVDILRVHLAHIDGGGEGVLPALMAVFVRVARSREATAVEWFVHATNCAKPNPRLRPILERRGFSIVEASDGTTHYFRRDELPGAP